MKVCQERNKIRVLHKVPSCCCAETSRYQLSTPATCTGRYSNTELASASQAQTALESEMPEKQKQY